MDNIWIPLLSALFGAIIGSVTTIATIFVQNYFQNKRENTKLAYEAAIQEQKSAVEFAKSINRTVVLPPLASFICYHTRIIKLALENNLTKENLEKLDSEMKQIDEVFEKK